MFTVIFLVTTLIKFSKLEFLSRFILDINGISFYDFLFKIYFQPIFYNQFLYTTENNQIRQFFTQLNQISNQFFIEFFKANLNEIENLMYFIEFTSPVVWLDEKQPFYQNAPEQFSHGAKNGWTFFYFNILNWKILKGELLFEMWIHFIFSPILPKLTCTFSTN